MKIVWISHSQKLGGAERCFWEAAKGLVSTGHEIHALLPSPGDLDDHLKQIGLCISYIPYAWWVRSGDQQPTLHSKLRMAASHLRAASRISKLLRLSKPDLVVSNTLATPVGALAAKWMNVPHIWYIHEFGKEDQNLAFDFGESFSLFILNKLSDGIIVNSRAVLRKFQRLLPLRKLNLVYYAIEVPTNSEGGHNVDHKQFNLMLVGQIAPGKRQEDAIRAVSILAKRGLEVKLTMMGSEHHPEYRTYLDRLARQLGVEGLVAYISFVCNPFSYIATADVVLMCSQMEAFGRVTVEAMKLGKAVVGGNSGGTAELIQDGLTGFLYRTGDAEDLAKKIEILYSDRALLKQIGDNALAWSKRTFTLENYAASLLAVFEETLKARSEQKKLSSTFPNF
jgi:glycosyltransferase involved in cell wall biosynthesis